MSWWKAPCLVLIHSNEQDHILLFRFCTAVCHFAFCWNIKVAIIAIRVSFSLELSMLPLARHLAMTWGKQVHFWEENILLKVVKTHAWLMFGTNHCMFVSGHYDATATLLMWFDMTNCDCDTTSCVISRSGLNTSSALGSFWAKRKWVTGQWETLLAMTLWTRPQLGWNVVNVCYLTIL